MCILYLIYDQTLNPRILNPLVLKGKIMEWVICKQIFYPFINTIILRL